MESAEQEMTVRKRKRSLRREMEACDSQQELRVQGSVDEGDAEEAF